MKKIINLYLSGLIILIGAIITNLILNLFKIPTWYDFINSIASNGIKNSIYQQGIIGIISLFIIYPFILGNLVLICIRFIRK